MRCRIFHFAASLLLAIFFVPELVSSAVVQVDSEWKEIFPPGVSAITGLHVESCIVLIAKEGGGINRSINCGDTWESIVPTDGKTVSSFVSTGGVLLGGSTEGAFRSEDDGRTWLASNSGLVMPMTPEGGQLVIPPVRLIANGSIVYAIGGYAQTQSSLRFFSLFISTNQGRTWEERLRGFPYQAHSVVGGKLILSDSLGIYTLNDDARGVTEIPSNFTNVVKAAKDIAGIGDTLVATGLDVDGTLNGEVYRSTDKGRTWIISKLRLIGSVGYQGPEYSPLSVLGNLIVITGGEYNSLLVNTSWDQGASWNWLDSRVSPYGGTEIRGIAANQSQIFIFSRGVMGSRLRRREYTAPPMSFATVSAASYQLDAVAPEAIVAGFGNALSNTTEIARTLPLPTTLAGIKVVVKEGRFGSERDAPLFFLSPGQINYQIPEGTPPGEALITVRRSAGDILASANILVKFQAPALFSADSKGSGVAAAMIARSRNNGPIVYEPVARYDPIQQKFTPEPVDLGPPTDQVYLILFGSGLGGIITREGALEKFQQYDGEAIVEYAGRTTEFVGLDQVNARLPRGLIGKGEIEFAYNGSNRVTVSFK